MFLEKWSQEKYPVHKHESTYMMVLIYFRANFIPNNKCNYGAMISSQLVPSSHFDRVYNILRFCRNFNSDIAIDSASGA